MNFDAIKTRPSAPLSVESPKRRQSAKEVAGKGKKRSSGGSASGIGSGSKQSSSAASVPTSGAARMRMRRVELGLKIQVGAVRMAPSAPSDVSRYEESFGLSDTVSGLSATLNTVFAEVCGRGLPFVFALSKVDGFELAGDKKVYPWADAYFEAYPSVDPDSDQSLSLHYVLDGDLTIRTFGSFAKVSQDFIL